MQRQPLRRRRLGGLSWPAVEEPKGSKTQNGAHGHGLPVVEFCVRWPARVVHVSFIPVGEVAADRGCEGHKREEDAAWRWHFVLLIS